MVVIRCGSYFSVTSNFFNIVYSIGILTPAFMRHYRRHSIVVILIASSFITPPDPVSMLIMSIPLGLLHETSIGISWIVNRKRMQKK